MISIIVPIYNVEQYLRECVDSILAQSFSDIEILLIDDGSSDGSGKICDEYATKDSRIRVFHTENRGVSAARNRGLIEARGEYIGFVDADDWIEKDMFQVLLTRMEETGSEVVFGCAWREEGGRSMVKGYDHEEIFTPTEAVRAMILEQLANAVWNKLYKAECWRGVLFTEGKVYEDISTTYKAVLNAHQVATTSACTYHYRYRENSITASLSIEKLKDYWYVCVDRYEMIAKMPQFSNDTEIMNRLQYFVAGAIGRNWRWTNAFPKQDRDRRHLREMSKFNRETFPMFGKKGWQLSLRVTTFLARYENRFSLATAHILNRAYRRIRAVH